jgi:hypothetical protein
MMKRNYTGLALSAALCGGMAVSSCLETTSRPAEPRVDAAFEAARGDAETIVGSLAAGNGAPSGPHYDLALIGAPKQKSADMSGNEANRILVPLESGAEVMLSQGDFVVLDANGTDGNAGFSLPNPDPDNDGTTRYSVFARAVGKPAGGSTVTTCATDPVSGEEFCSVYVSVLVREKDGTSFTSLSKELLLVFADPNGDGKVERVPLFGSALQDYLWRYDNNGLKVAELRFYEVPTTVTPVGPT